MRIFLRRYDQHRAVQFLAFVDELSVLSVQPFDADQLQLAGKVVRKYADQRLTLADAHGLVIMQQRRIADCWSTDRHLAMAGARLAI